MTYYPKRYFFLKTRKLSLVIFNKLNHNRIIKTIASSIIIFFNQNEGSIYIIMYFKSIYIFLKSSIIADNDCSVLKNSQYEIFDT